MAKISAYAEQTNPDNDDVFIMVRAGVNYKIKMQTLMEYTPANPGAWGSPTPDDIREGLDLLVELVASATITDGVYGQITVSSGGTVWSVTEPTLAALGAYNTNGLLTQTAADTFTGRTITGTANEISVADGSGVAGNPTLSLPATIDLGGKTSFELPNSAAPTVDADGEIAVDTTVADFSHGILKYFSGEELAVIAVPVAQLSSPTNNYVVTYDSTADEFQLKAASGGSSKYRKVFHVYNNEPPTSNFATLDLRNNHPVLDFDTTTGEVAIFSDVLAPTYGGGGIKVEAHWASDSTTGTVGWLIAIERIGTALDIDTDSFAADQTITAAATSGTSGIVTITSVTISNGANMDSLAAGEAYRIRITRDVANDTVGVDANLLKLVVEEQ